MDEYEATRTISNLLESARNSVESALSLGKTYRVPVDLNIVGLGDPGMWYVSVDEYRETLMNDLTWDDRVPTEEELAEVERQIKEVEDNGGYGHYGEKVTGWMSSSTNC